MDVKSLERSGEVAALRHSGQLLLIGPWYVFEGISRSLVINDPSRLRAVLFPFLRDDMSLAKLSALYRRLMCTSTVAGQYSAQQITEQMMALMRVGQICAVALPDTASGDIHGNVRPAHLSSVRAGPVSQWPLADRFSFVLQKSLEHMPSALKSELAGLISGANLAIIVGGLVVWAGSHAVGVGFVADAALIAIGFAFAGWSIFSGIKSLAQFFNLTIGASSVNDLNAAAEQFAAGVMAMGAGAVIAMLTRGAARLTPRNTPRPARQPSAPTPPKPAAGQPSAANDDLVQVYRGTDRVAENATYQDTGHLLSDSAQRTYRETGSLDAAYDAANTNHQKWIDVWGDEKTYSQAHGAFGTEMSPAFGMDRTFISVTTDPARAGYFANGGGTVYQGLVPRSQLLDQTLPGAGEQELLLRGGTGLLRPVD